MVQTRLQGRGFPMKSRLVVLVILCCLVVAVSILNSQKGRSQGKAESTLSKDEEELLKEINEARAHPDVYAGYLENLKPLFSGKIYKGTLATEEGWAAVEEAIAFLRATKPQPPLTTSSGLCSAAVAHVKEQSGSGATGHKSSGSGVMIEDRVKHYGSWQGGIGENLSYGNDPARERELTWLIDDGFATRGHRKRLMSPDYKVAGTCCGPHPEFGKMCVLTLAGGFTDSMAATQKSDSPNKSDSAMKSEPPTSTLSAGTPKPSNSNTNANSNTGAA